MPRPRVPELAFSHCLDWGALASSRYQEERERVTRPSHPKAPPTDRSRQQPTRRNINQWLDKGKANGKVKGKDTEEAARERERYRRWERDHVE